MKKLFVLLGLTLGLWALPSSLVQAEIVPWHINTYNLSSNAGTFTDISTNPNAVALGTDLVADADLKNRTFSQAFIYDTTYLKGVDGGDSVRNGVKVIDHITTTIDRSKTATNYSTAASDVPTVAGFPLGFEFNLCGNKMTHFVVSAFGGVYFRNDTLQGLYPTFLSQFGSFGVFAHPFLKGNATATATTLAGAGKVFKNGSNAPAYYLIEGTDGNHVLTVQHNYMVQGAGKDEWTFQFKFYEATGKIDFIVKELQYANAFEHATQGKWHRIFISLTDYAAYPKTFTDGTPYTPTDPYAATGLQITAANGSNHRLSPAQTNEASAAGWGTFTIAGNTDEGSTMRIDANGPGEGRTISFTPKNAPATVEPLTADHYTQLNETVTENSYTTQLVYNTAMFPKLSDIAAAGPIMAVISKSETPDYTLENGTLYTLGHEFSTADGFKPKVIANMMPKINANVSANTWAYANKDYEVILQANDLEKQTEYYIHLYRLAYTGQNAPTYSTVCHTLPFTTPNDPKTLKADLADIDGVNLTVVPADNFGVIVIKSSTPNVKPNGQLKKGDKIGNNAEVIELLTEEKTWKLPLAYGEGCFIIAISVNMQDENHYVYSPTKKYISVGTAYKGLPGLVDFTHLSFGVPNWEYNGIDIRTQNFRKIESTTYRDLPFGYTRTDIETAKDRAFGLGQPAYFALAPRVVYAKTPQKNDEVQGDMDLITPPIVADNNRILMTFNARWMTSDDGGNIIDMTVGGEKDANLYCAIEYAIEGGEWQHGADFHGYDLMAADDGYFPISYALTAPTGESFIGKKIRFRFVSKFVDPTNKVRGFVGIGSIDVKEDKLCQTVNHIVLRDSLTTSTQIGLKWDDHNTPAAPAYEISYRPANDTNDLWRTKKTETAAATLENLVANTVYAVRITADCGTAYGKAYASQTTRFSTTYKFPFTDNLAQDENETIIVNGAPVSVAGKTPFDRGVTSFIGALPDEGYATLNTPQYGWTVSASSARVINNEKRSTSVGVRETEARGWLLMPTVYIPIYKDVIYPQTIRFKANSAHRYANEKAWTPGIGSRYTNAKLYVLVSYNGQFAKKDIVATIEVSGKDITQQAFEFDVPEALLSDGRAQVAFFFDNPKATDGGEGNDAGNDDAMLFEIYDFEYVYTDNACLPTSNLTLVNTTAESATFSWEGYNKLYKLFWALRTEAGYTDSATTTEPAYTITGLQEKMNYKLRIVGYCGADGTEVGPNALTTRFTTQENCHVPEDFAVSGITQTSATFSSTNEQSVLTQRLVYLTPQIENGTTRIVLQAGDQVTANNLRKKTPYVALTRSVCGLDSSDFSEPISFTTAADSLLIMLRVLPDESYGTVTGQGRYEEGSEATITAIPAEGFALAAWVFGNDTVSTDAVYTFKVTTAGTYTAIFTDATANEETVSTAFNVSAKAGHLYIQNLKGLTIEEVTVYGVTGRRLARFTPRSREDLSLPVAAERAVLVVRVASEQGLATYKVYLQ